MRAIVCREYGSPAELTVSEVDAPAPGPGEVRLTIDATGLGYVDALTVAGRYQIKPPLPFIPGNEIAGTVESLGAGVNGLAPGDRVLAMPPRGGLAEQVCVAGAACTKIPAGLSSEAAAGFLINYCTAWHGLMDCGKLASGETVLVLGASGGVGAAAIDVARAAGARVIAAASTEEKRQACLALGAGDVLDYSRENWRTALAEVLAGRPLNVVYDPVGGAFAEPALRSLAPDGRFLVVGFATGEIPRIPLNLALLKRISIIGVNWGGYVAGDPARSQPVLDRLLGLIEAGRLSPEAGEVFPLEQAGRAMMKMLERKAIGKIVIGIGDRR